MKVPDSGGSCPQAAPEDRDRSCENPGNPAFPLPIANRAAARCRDGEGLVAPLTRSATLRRRAVQMDQTSIRRDSSGDGRRKRTSSPATHFV
jgi:hypothetical protein